MTSKIQPSKPPRQRSLRIVNHGHLHWIASLPCLLCGAPDHSDAHHLKPACAWAGKEESAGTYKTDDYFVVPLCRKDHNDLHFHGNEKGFWRLSFGADGWNRAVRTALALWAAHGRNERATTILEKNSTKELNDDED